MGAQNGFNENYGKQIQDVLDNREKILKEVYPEFEKGESRVLGVILDNQVGNPGSGHYFVGWKVNGKEYHITARNYGATPKIYQAPTSPCEKAAESYQFLKNAGIEGIPECTSVEGLDKWLFTEFITGKTLRQVLEERDDSGKKEELEKLVRAIASSQYKATKHRDDISFKQRERIFWSRKTETQIKNYHNICAEKENSDEETRAFVKLYMRLLGESLKGGDICHGDLSPDNIMVNPESGLYYYLDPELKERNGFSDLGSLISYSGDFEHLWCDLGEMLHRSKLETAVRQGNGKVKGLGGRIAITEEGKAKSRFDFFANLLNPSFRKMAKILTADYEINPDSFNIQRDNIFKVLNSWIDKPEKFGLTDEQADMASDLKEDHFEKMPSLQAVKAPEEEVIVESQ